MSITAVVGIGILAGMLVAGGYLVYQNEDSAFALLSNVWESLPPSIKDAITYPWRLGRHVVRYGREVWEEVVRVLKEKRGMTQSSNYEVPVTADVLDLNDFGNYHYCEPMDSSRVRYWYYLYPASSGQVEIIFEKDNIVKKKFVITFQEIEMSPEPYMIKIERYRLEDGQYVLENTLERAGTSVKFWRLYITDTNNWSNFYVYVYNSQENSVGSDSFPTIVSYRCSLSILDGSFTNRREVVYNPTAGDVQVNTDVLPEDAARKDVSIPGIGSMSDLLSHLRKLVGVTEDGYSDVVDISKGIADYVGDIYDALTAGFTSVVSGINSIADVLSTGLIGDLDIDYSPLLNLSIVDKFPFSLPFDMYNAISGFSVGGDLPEINFGFYDPVNKRIINNRIDLGEIDFIVDYAPFVRAVLLFCYIVGLVYISRRILGGGV